MEHLHSRTPEELLNEKRELIDEVDQQIVALLNYRAQIAIDIGTIKAEHNLPVLVSSREDQVLKQVEEINESGIIPQAEIRNIFQAIMKGSRAVQEDLRNNQLPSPQDALK